MVAKTKVRESRKTQHFFSTQNMQSPAPSPAPDATGVDADLAALYEWVSVGGGCGGERERAPRM